MRWNGLKARFFKLLFNANCVKIQNHFLFRCPLFEQYTRNLDLKSFTQTMSSYNPSNIFARSRLVKTRHVTEYSLAKTGQYPRIFPNFQNCTRCEKDLKNNKHSSLHLGRKYARIFILGHDLFLKAHSFPRATLSENCSLLGTDTVRGQIY